MTFARRKTIILVGKVFENSGTFSKKLLRREALSILQIYSHRFQHALPISKEDKKVKQIDQISWKDTERDSASHKTRIIAPAQLPDMDFVKLCQASNIAPKIAFIGGGNMAQAMMKGFLNSGLLSFDQIGVSDPFPAALEAAKKLNISTELSNKSLLEKFGTGIVILAVKPDVLANVLDGSKDLLKQSGIIVTIIAGATIDSFENMLDMSQMDGNLPIVRVMPNTAAIVGCAASVFCRGNHVSDAQAELVKTLMETIGSCREVSEKHLDAVTGLSGSGPAFVYTMIDAMSDGGVKMGLDRDLATHLTAQTGAAKMVMETKRHPGDLKNMVCSPGGTTITGVSVLEERGLRAAMIAAVEAATKRSQELGKK